MQDSPIDEATQSGMPDPSNETVDVLDPNDPALTSEALDINTEGDAYAQPAPPPDGRYRAKLKLSQPENAQKQRVDYVPSRSNKPPVQSYFKTGIEASIIDPSGKYDGIKVYDRWVGTFVGRDGASKVTTILGVLRKPDGSAWLEKGRKYTHKELMDTLVRALAGEPEVEIETQWEWSCEGCGKEAKDAGKPYPRSITGMAKFPLDGSKSKPGAPVHLPEMKCQVNQSHAYSRAQVRVGSIKAVKR
jgi:hypothetical protein